MSTKNAIQVLIGAILFFLTEYVVFSLTRMGAFLQGGGLASAIAYKFVWLMVLTAAIGIFAPVAAAVEKGTGKTRAGLASWFVLVGFTMVGFTALSFIRLSTDSAAGILSPAGAAQKIAPKVSERVTFEGSKIEQVDADTIRAELQFKNQTGDEYTEIDYNFAAIDGEQIFYRIKIRDGVYFPPRVVSTTALTWHKSDFKDPALFNRIFTAQQGGRLKVYARVERLVRIDGKAIEG